MTHNIGVVVLSGWSTGAQVWDSVLNPISRSHEATPIVHIDWWDGIINPEQALRQAVETVNSRANNPLNSPVILVGWSLGGQIALQAADMVPELVQNMLLISTPVRLLADEDGYGTDPAALRAMRHGLRRDSDTILKNFWSEASAGDQTGFNIADVFEDILADVDYRTLDKGLAALGANDLRKRLSMIPVPAVVIQCEEDRIVPPHSAQQLADGLQFAQVLTVQGGSHALPLTHPHMITEVLQALITANDQEAAQ